MASNTPNLQLYKKDPVTDGADVFNIETMLNENWDKIDEAGATYAEGIKEAYDKAASAQLQKITADSGGVKVSVSDEAVDFLAKMEEQGRGMHTFYCLGGAVNGPPTTVRGHAFFTGINPTYGYIQGIDHVGNTWTNYCNGTWTGWRKLASTEFEYPNLLKNSTGALGLQNWTNITPSKGTWLTHQTNPNVGSQFYTTATGDGGSAHCLDSDKISVVAGSTFHLQSMFHTSGITSGGVYIEVLSGDKTTIIGNLFSDLNKSWHRKQTTITIPSGITSVIVRLVVLNTNSGTKYFSRIKFCRSTIDTPYSSEADDVALFQSVSDGKGKIETAITGKGGTVSKAGSVATFDELATGIAGISTGKKWATGTITLKIGTTATISGLGFNPSIVYMDNIDYLISKYGSNALNTYSYNTIFMDVKSNRINYASLRQSSYENRATEGAVNKITNSVNGVTWLHDNVNSTFKWTAIE